MNVTITKSNNAYMTKMPSNISHDKVVLAFHYSGKEVMKYIKENNYVPIFDRTIDNDEMLAILLGIL